MQPKITVPVTAERYQSVNRAGLTWITELGAGAIILLWDNHDTVYAYSTLHHCIFAHQPTAGTTADQVLSSLQFFGFNHEHGSNTFSIILDCDYYDPGYEWELFPQWNLLVSRCIESNVIRSTIPVPAGSVRDQTDYCMTLIHD